MTVFKQLYQFIETAEGMETYNQWLCDKTIKVYVRKSIRYIEGIFFIFFDVASITVEPKYRQQGLFKSFVLKAHQEHPWQGTYLESVQNEIIVKWCIRNNWKNLLYTNPSTFYLLKK